jgi:ABC-type polysaccharide/polyol phosphate transport system ATPase subunit
MVAIQFENVSKRYRLGSRSSLRETLYSLPSRLLQRTGVTQDDSRCLWALKDVSFEVQQGEVLGIIGPNGAGKTTTLKLLSRVTVPTRGRTTVQGRTSALIELGAGFHPDLTGRENIYLNGAILGLKRKEIDARFDGIVDFAELERFIDTPVKRYSSGMYARLGFSVAAFTDPDVLLVDEVLSVGDILFQQKCLKKIDEFKSQSKTIVFVSHNMGSIQRICSRVIWLDGGKIQADGNPGEVVSRYFKHQLSNRRTASQLAEGEVPIRYGTGDAEIQDVRILNRDGRAGEAFEVGEDVCIHIDYQAHRRIAPVNFRIVVTNDEGLKLGGVDFFTEDYAGLGSLQGSGTVQCTLQSMSLRSGAYFLIVVIEEGGIALDRQGMVGPFVVKEDRYRKPDRYGFIKLRATWSVCSSPSIDNSLFAGD